MSFLNAGMYQIPSKFVQGAAVLAYQQYTIRGYWHFLAPGVLEHFRFYFKICQIVLIFFNIYYSQTELKHFGQEIF